MSDKIKVVYNIYSEKFSYAQASKDSNCEGVVEKKKCPALMAQRQGAGHPLIPLGICAGCRKDPERYIKEWKRLDRQMTQNGVHVDTSKKR